MKKKNLCLLLLFALLCGGCELIDYHPYDVRIKGETDINAKNIRRIEEACRNKTTLRFAVIGDTQRWYDETESFVKAVNKREDIDFVIHGGDVSDFGLTDEFLWQRDIMNGLRAPYVVLIGNHDCLGTGEEVYRKVFGPVNFSFIAGDVKFVCLNTNALEYDYSEPVPDFTFIENQLTERKEEYRRTVFSMHAQPYSDVFNNNVAKVFQHYIKQYPNLQFCLAAHDHSLGVTDLFGDGVLYYRSASIKKRNYLLFTINPTDYSYEVVYY
ncbi:MAG: metallophosphoesterase [Bacteroides sp.]|uniref:metallophosphoesterase family protein n=1 Tax=Bacteroides sp. TaxID=29523 RepID=UPI002FC745DD